MNRSLINVRQIRVRDSYFRIEFDGSHEYKGESIMPDAAPGVTSSNRATSMLISIPLGVRT